MILSFMSKYDCFGIILEPPANTELSSFVRRSNVSFFLRQRSEKFLEDKLVRTMLTFVEMLL